MGQYATAEEAKALLEKAVAAIKKDKAKAIDMFNKGEGGFKDRDLYVYCANASDGIITAVAERVGFEPTARLPIERFAKPHFWVFKCSPYSYDLLRQGPVVLRDFLTISEPFLRA